MQPQICTENANPAMLTKGRLKPMRNQKLPLRRRLYTIGMKGLMLVSAAFTGGLVLFLILFVLIRGLPHVPN